MMQIYASSLEDVYDAVELTEQDHMMMVFVLLMVVVMMMVLLVVEASIE